MPRISENALAEKGENKIPKIMRIVQTNLNRNRRAMDLVNQTARV